VKVLVVGGGGREHALCWAVRRDVPAATVFAAPGNPGTATLATNLPIAATALDDLVAAVRQHGIELVIVGPEAPLAAGLADRLTKAGVAVFGPSAAAARVESSKAFAKHLMQKLGIPTAASATFTELERALGHIERHTEPLVVKASGLAAGKGAVVCATRAEARAVARAMLAEGKFGDAGREIVIEEFLEGEELSILALTDGERIVMLPPAQDHKRLGEGDTGPNTGGMGAYCPVSLTRGPLLQRVKKEIIAPVLGEMAAARTPYVGVLYVGLMIRADGSPAVIEFNSRFGDPETQAVIPVLPPGLTHAMGAIATGTWQPETDVIEPRGAAVSVVLASRGYPDKPETGAAITIPDDLGAQVLVFHGGTARDTDGVLRVAGGRVLNVTGMGRDVASAARASLIACERIQFDGKTYRRDIGRRELQRARAT
jgi:phosphoribosylamine--glycine ligase